MQKKLSSGNTYDSSGNLLSVDPPIKYLTFGPWIYLVPQYKPQSVLILGFAGGTVAGLIRLLYGDILIYGVDLQPCEPKYDVKFFQADAKEFVKTCGHFDVVIVDLTIDSEVKVCDFVLTKEFAWDLSKIANYIIINTMNEVDMSAYNFLKKEGVNKPSGLGNKIYYYSVREIPHLHTWSK